MFYGAAPGWCKGGGLSIPSYLWFCVQWEEVKLMRFNIYPDGQTLVCAVLTGVSV